MMKLWIVSGVTGILLLLAAAVSIGWVGKIETHEGLLTYEDSECVLGRVYLEGRFCEGNPELVGTEKVVRVSGIRTSGESIGVDGLNRSCFRSVVLKEVLDDQ